MGEALKVRLGKALSVLMKESADLQTIDALAKKTGIPRSSIDRAKRGLVDLQLDKLEPLAQAFGLRAWELLRAAESAPAAAPAPEKGQPRSRPIGQKQLALVAEAQRMAGTIPDAQAVAIRNLILACSTMTYDPANDPLDAHAAAAEKPKSRHPAKGTVK